MINGTVSFHQAYVEIAAAGNRNHALNLIAGNARQVFDTDMAIIRLLDERNQKLHLAACVGARGFDRTLKVGRGLPGLAAERGEPIVCADYRSDPRCARWGTRAQEASGVNSYLCVPMVSESRMIGVIGIGNRTVTHFSSDQVRMLQLFASVGATALERVLVSDGRARAPTDLLELVDELSARLSLVRHGVALRDHFTDLLLEEKERDDIVRSLSRLIAMPVTFEERQAYGFPGREWIVANECQCLQGGAECQSRVADQVAHGRRLVHVARVLPTDSRDSPRMIAPILADGELLGWLVVREVDRALGEFDIVAVEQAAIALALDMARKRQILQVECRLKGSFVADLVYGNYDDETILSRAAHLGTDLTKPHRVMVFEVDNGDTLSELDSIRRRLLNTICLMAPESCSTKPAGDEPDRIIVLCKAESEDSADGPGTAALRLASALKQRVSRDLPEITLSIGIGRRCCQPADYRLSYQEAIRALRVVRSLGHTNRVVFFEQLGAHSLLYETHQPGRLARFVDETLGTLFEEDARHKTQLVRTLAKYLDNNCNLNKTAAQLFLHVNSLRHRLQRCEEIAELDLGDADTRFNLLVALRIARLAGRCQF